MKSSKRRWLNLKDALWRTSSKHINDTLQWHYLKYLPEHTNMRGGRHVLHVFARLNVRDFLIISSVTVLFTAQLVDSSLFMRRLSVDRIPILFAEY